VSGRKLRRLKIAAVILSEAKDLFAPEPSSGLSSGLKRFFVAALLRMTTCETKSRRLMADG
jgi:ABC-type multidrug transport system ATPase subunit